MDSCTAIVPLAQSTQSDAAFVLDKYSNKREASLEMLRDPKFTNCPGAHTANMLRSIGFPVNGSGFVPEPDATREIVVPLVALPHFMSVAYKGGS